MVDGLDPWTPESGRPPTDDELMAYAQSQIGAQTPDVITEPYVAPADIPVEPQPELPAWTPESGRPPTDEELLAYSEYSEPEPPPEPEVIQRLTPEEELRETPGITGKLPGTRRRERREAQMREAGELPPLEPERIEITEPLTIRGEPQPEPWDPNSGITPTDEQLLLYTGLDPELEPVATPSEPVEVNPVVLPAPGENFDVGRTRTYSSRLVRDFSSVVAGIPKTIQLWFAPDTDLLGWMDEMDRIDAMPEGQEKFDAQVQHISRGMQKYGTLANVNSARYIDMYVEGPKNKGEQLEENRRKARAQFNDELRKTIERPLYRAGETIDQTVRDYFPTNPEYQDEFLADVFGGLGSMGGFMLAFAVTRGPTQAVVSRTGLTTATLPGRVGIGAIQATPTAGLGITIQQSMAFENALRAGADIDVAFDAAYSPYTTIAGASEAVPIANFFNRADKASGGQISAAIRRMVIQGTEEGIQEGFQTVMENLTAQDLYDPERQLWTGAPYASGVGFTTGALVEFIGSLLPGRRRAMAQRADERGGPESLEAQLDAARAEVAAAGGDALDQAEAASAVMAEQAPDVAATKERILAEREARAQRAEAGEGPGMAPLAELAQAEARLAQAGFDERAAAVGQGILSKIAEQKERMFAEREAQVAQEREVGRQEAEVQRAEQETAAQEEVAEAVEAQEVAPTTIAEAIEPETRAGLERMRAALAAEAEPVEAAEPEVVEEAPPALPAPALRVTPEGEVLPPSEVTRREEARLARREEAEIERPFEAETMEAMAQQPALPAERPTQEANAIIDAKANQAATSPLSDVPMPTEAQLETGQYKKGELGPQDLDMPGVRVAIENPKGTVREGPGWRQKMRDHYGFIRGTESAEGPREQIDAFIGDQPESPMVFVVDQVNQNTGQFDEHKVMIGYANQMDAVRGYKRNYSKGWKVGPVTAMTKEQFTRWLDRGDQTQPVNQQLRQTMPLAGEAAFAEEVEAAQAQARARARDREPVVRFRVEGEAEPTADQVRIPSASVAASMLGPIPAVPKPKPSPEEQQTAMEEERTAKDMEKVTAAPEAAVGVTEAREAVKPLLTELVQLRPRILASPEDAPTDLSRALRARGALRAKGAFFDGQLYVFANNHSNVDDISRTILHEGVAHQGLRALYKDESILNDLLDDVYAGMSDADIEAMRARSRAYADIDLSQPEGQRELAEEHIAHLAETDPQQGMVKRFVQSIRQLLRAAGLDLKYNNDDIVAILRDARRELRQVVPLERINVVSQVEVAETGEIIEVEEQADIALRQLDKRQGVIETLRGCLA